MSACDKYLDIVELYVARRLRDDLDIQRNFTSDSHYEAAHCKEMCD